MNQGEKARLLIGPNALKNATLREYVKGLKLNDPELDSIARYRDNFGSQSFSEYKRSLNPARAKSATSNAVKSIDKAKDALVSGHERFGLSKAEAEYIAKNAPDQVVESAVYGSQANSNAGPRNWLNASKVTIDPKSTTLSDQAAQAKNVATQQNVEAINSSVTPETGAPLRSSGVSAINQAKLELAQEYMKNRTPGPMYSDKDWEAYNTIKQYGDTGDTRWYRSPEYEEFHKNVGEYNTKIRRYARNKYGLDSPDYDKFVDENIIERGHINAKNNRGFAHLRDVDGNLATELKSSNRPKKASMTWAEWVNGMEFGSGKPMGRRGELKSIKNMIQTLSNEGLDVSDIQGNFDYFNKLPKYEEALDELDKSFNVEMFDKNGRFLSRGAMPEGTTPEQYERLRRLFITMADANPNFDLDAYISQNKLPQEFIDGIPVDGKDAASLETVREGNRPTGQKYLSTKADAAESLLSTKQRKTAAGLLTFLSSVQAAYPSVVGGAAKMLPFVGVPFAAEEAVSSWNEGNYIRSGVNALDAVTLGITPLGWADAGFEIAEQNGSMQSNIDAERAQAGVTSAADIAKQRYGQLRNIWTNDD